MTRFVLLFVLLFISSALYAQETVTPFTARAYWEELQDPAYRKILDKQSQGIDLSGEERRYIDFYDKHLEDYYKQLSSDEQSKFQTFRQQWDEEADELRNEEPSDVLETNARGVLPGKKYRLYNGLFGFVYGAMMIPVLGIEDSQFAIGLPLVLAGGSLLLPVVNPKKYENMTYSSVLLNRHGKFYGLLDGAALSLLIFGDEDESDARVALGMAVAGSIIMGEIGFQMGKNKNWTEGRIAGYTHYATVSVLTGLGLYASFTDSYDSRMLGGIILVSQAGGYLLANSLWKKYDYTRGDMLASGSFTLFSTMLGIGLIGQVESSDDQRKILLPTFALLGGSLLSHTILKNLKLTAKQGWKVNYIAGAGALIGLGTALIINPSESTLYFILPAAGGLIGWGAMVKGISKNNQMSADNKTDVNFSFSVHPENYFFNKNTPFEKLTPDMPARSVVGLRYSF